MVQACCTDAHVRVRALAHAAALHSPVTHLSCCSHSKAQRHTIMSRIAACKWSSTTHGTHTHTLSTSLTQGRNIRFVHLPRSLDPEKLLNAHVRRAWNAKAIICDGLSQFVSKKVLNAHVRRAWCAKAVCTFMLSAGAFILVLL